MKSNKLSSLQAINIYNRYMYKNEKLIWIATGNKQCLISGLLEDETVSEITIRVSGHKLENFIHKTKGITIWSTLTAAVLPKFTQWKTSYWGECKFTLAVIVLHTKRFNWTYWYWGPSILWYSYQSQFNWKCAGLIKEETFAYC